jgi:MFS family permease
MAGVEQADGWQPLERPRRTARPHGGVGSTSQGPFARMARAHALITGADTLVALALAGSLFFSISPDAARSRVALYLALTMAPFAVVAPLIGPAIDRRPGGRRSMIVLSAAARAVLCMVMARHLDSLLLFPEAFAVLVLGKSYGVARASLVPGLVRSPSELVQANAKLVLVSSVVGFLVAIPGLGLLQLGSPWVLGGAATLFSAGVVAALRLPKVRVAAEAPSVVEQAELRGAGILLAASAMAVLRATVGFLAFLLAFELRQAGEPSWFFGAALAASGVGALAGAGVAPRLRRHVREERMLLGALVGVALASASALALQLDRRTSAVLLALVVGVAASAGRLCFDAIVQRDAPDANQGRSFARFETRFQIAWVAGAFLPVAIPLPLSGAYLGMAVVTAAAAVSYATGRELTGALRRRARVDQLAARVRERVDLRRGAARLRAGRRPR